jgi:protein tyrosine phosphatase
MSFKDLPIDYFYSCKIGLKNQDKNRFKDVMPYDNNYICLLDGTYVNASNVNGYIVTQHPFTTVINNFWTMLYQYNIDTIVQLNKTPYLSTPEIITKEIKEFYTITTYMCKEKKIKHFHFLNWEDENIPNMDNFIHFLETIYNTNPEKIVIHCMAGLGRTGCFCYGYDLLTKKTNLKPFEYILNLRDQRAKMISNELQFNFCIELYKKFIE